MVTFKEFFSFKNNRFFWLNLIAMVVVIVAAPLGTLQWLDNYTRHGEAVYAIDEFIEKIKSEEKIVYLLDNCN